MMSIQGNFKTAAVFILIAMVADALDGRVARALHTAGPMGVELDSLSDDISFGIAAGALMYAYQLHELGPLGFIPCALLGTFCAFRLARFNVKVTSVHGYFEGLPCPTTGVIVAAYVLSGIKFGTGWPYSASSFWPSSWSVKSTIPITREPAPTSFICRHSSSAWPSLLFQPFSTGLYGQLPSVPDTSSSV